MKESKESNQEIEPLDLLKEIFEKIPKPSNPILNRYLLEYDLFYQRELRLRSLIDKVGTDITVGELAEKCKEIEIDFFKHSGDKMNYLGNSLFWIGLFSSENLEHSDASAFLTELQNTLKMDKIALESDLEVDKYTLSKSLSQLTESEVKAINFNFSRPFRLPVVEERLRRLQPFLDNYSHIPPNQKLLKELKTKKNKKEVKKGFDLGLPDKKLRQLYSDLINAGFLPKNSIETHFINAFNGRELNTDFKPLKWIEPTVGAIILYKILNGKPKWKAIEHLFESANYKQLLHQSKSNGAFDQTIKKFNEFYRLL